MMCRGFDGCLVANDDIRLNLTRREANLFDHVLSVVTEQSIISGADERIHQGHTALLVRMAARIRSKL